MILYIAEKPALGEAIGEALPGTKKVSEQTIIKGENVVIWCFGHLLTLLDPEDYDEKYKKWELSHLPIYFKDWKMKPSKDKVQRVKQIGNLLKQADMVVNCGDIDEEGQLLVDELLRYFNYQGPVKRLDTSNTTKSALERAIAKMKDNRECEADGWSAYARMLCDKMFGYNFTRFFTLKNNTILPVGRVQTPTLGMVVMRDRQIEGHEKTVYYDLSTRLLVKCSAGEVQITAKYIPDKENKELTDGHFLSQTYLNDLSKHLNGFCANAKVSRKEEKKNPPLPFNLTALNTYCGKKFGYKPDQVMSITQSLRDKHRAITYNRSDCQYLSSDHYKEAPQTIASTCQNLGISTEMFHPEIKSRCFNDANITAHFAIIPSGEPVNLAAMTEQERNVYECICRFYLIQFMPPAVFEKITLEEKLPDKGMLRATASRIKSPGYMSYGGDADDGQTVGEEAVEEDNESGSLFQLPDGEHQTRVKGTEISEKETKPPARYTQTTLYNDMTCIAKYAADPEVKRLLMEKDKDKKGENGSIGTSATRAEIIKGLIARGYLSEEKKGKKEYLVSTQKGRAFYDSLPDEIKKIDVTARWWVIQEDIKAGRATVDTLVTSVLDTIRQVMASDCKTLPASVIGLSRTQNNAICACPKCGGDVKENTKGYYCSNYKNGCQLGGLWKNACWVTITKADIPKLLSGKTIEKTAKTKAGKSYKKKLIYDMEAGEIKEVKK